MNKATEAFRVADNDDRIKRALKSRIASYNNEVFTTEDNVYFKEKDKLEWSGPATVIGQQGKVIFLKYGHNLRRVHMSRLIKVGEEYQSKNKHELEMVQKEDEDNIETIDEKTSLPKDHKEKLQ